jgi:ATP-dependent helicase YprA (DUF1998 family)
VSRKIPVPDELDTAILLYQEARKDLELHQREVEAHQARIIDLLRRRGIKTHTFGKTKVTMVRPETMTFDENGLRKALGAKVFNKLTTAKLDRKKLEKAIESGEIDPVVVAQNTTLILQNTHIRVTEKSNDPA